MRIAVTGATGFVGSRLVARLMADGHTVVGLARSPGSAQKLIDRGCKFVQGDLWALPAVRTAVQRCDAVFHLAAEHRLGIRRQERKRMRDTNVLGTECLLDAAIEEGVPRIVHCSGVTVFGDTHGQVVDETYRRPEGEGFLSYADETKTLGHRLAEARIADGAPITIVQPGQIYGPGDTSAVGLQLAAAAAGTLERLVFPGLGLVFCHVDDVVDGLLRALASGRPGRRTCSEASGRRSGRRSRSPRGRAAGPRRRAPSRRSSCARSRRSARWAGGSPGCRRTSAR
ncbi:MAG: NAD-dependent epimerase/dehydratase family protein [Thermoleophilia bacterium]